MKTNNHCPDEEILAGYIEGKLAAQEQEAVESHLGRCRSCLEELALTKSMLRGNEDPGLQSVPPKVTDRAISLIFNSTANEKTMGERIGDFFHSMYTSLREQMAWGIGEGNLLAPIRGDMEFGQNQVHIRKCFKEFDVDIEIEKTGAGQSKIRIDSTWGRGGKQDMRFTLQTPDREVASYIYNGIPVVFESIPLGQYTLNFSRNGTAIGKYSFVLKDSENDN